MNKDVLNMKIIHQYKSHYLLYLIKIKLSIKNTFKSKLNYYLFNLIVFIK